MRKGCKPRSGGRRVLPVLLLLLLSGCASLWEREIYERIPHLAREEGALAAAALTVNSYDSLKTAIIGVIRNGESEADIRVTDYPGGLTKQAVSALLTEIQKWEPIGAYTVEYIDFDYTHILSQYTITLNIVYRFESRPVITPVSGRRELEQAVHAALRDYKPLLTVEMPYYYAQEHDVEGMVRSYYYTNPAWAAEYPETAVSLYPPSGNSLRRIIDLELVWQTPEEELRQKERDTDDSAGALLQRRPDFMSGSAEEFTAQTVLWLHDALCETVLYDAYTAMLELGERPRVDADIAYGALAGGLAVSEGHAMAFKLLCDRLDIDCAVVTGRWKTDGHTWNLVRIGDTWYHLAIALDNRGPVPVYDFFLLDDEEAALEFFDWNKNIYPAALPGFWTADAIRALTETEEE